MNKHQELIKLITEILEREYPNQHPAQTKLVPLMILAAVASSLEPKFGELNEYAQDLRSDWSEFDGRTNLHVINDWIDEIQVVLKGTKE